MCAFPARVARLWVLCPVGYPSVEEKGLLPRDFSEGCVLQRCACGCLCSPPDRPFLPWRRGGKHAVRPLAAKRPRAAARGRPPPMVPAAMAGGQGKEHGPTTDARPHTARPVKDHLIYSGAQRPARGGGHAAIGAPLGTSTMTTRTSIATSGEWFRCHTIPSGGDAYAGLMPSDRPERSGTTVPRGGCLGARSGAACARHPRRAGPGAQSVPTGARARPAARPVARRPGVRCGAPGAAPFGRLGGAGSGHGARHSGRGWCRWAGPRYAVRLVAAPLPPAPPSPEGRAPETTRGDIRRALMG